MPRLVGTQIHGVSGTRNRQIHGELRVQSHDVFEIAYSPINDLGAARRLYQGARHLLRRDVAARPSAGWFLVGEEK